MLLSPYPDYGSTAKFGRNTSLTTVEDIIDQGGTLVTPSDTGTAVFVKASVDSATTQGMPVQVWGLDANWEPATVASTLDAADSTTEVAVGTFARVFRAKVLGSTNADQNIVWGPAGFATTYLQITTPNNQSLFCAFSVARYRKAWVRRWGASINKAAAASDREASLFLYVKPFGTTWQLKHVFGLATAGTSVYEKQWDILAPDEGGIQPKSDIKVSATATAGSDISSWFDLVVHADLATKL